MTLNRNPSESAPGFGLRLRNEYLPEILAQKPGIDFIEVITESYLEASDPIAQQLDELSNEYPVALHGISLAIGSPWPMDQDYIANLKQLIQRIQPAWVSDHLCWKGADDEQGILLPLPYSEETLQHLVNRIKQVQDALGQQLLLENVPAEAGIPQQIPEAEFICEVAEQSDSLILIDIGNLLNSCINLDISTDNYLARIPAERVRQIHLPDIPAVAGELSTPQGEGLFGPIWELYIKALERFGRVSTVLEREDTIPTLQDMLKEVKTLRAAMKHYEQAD